MDLLGRGQQATVFLVRDRAKEGTQRALKLLDTRLADPSAVERLRREYRVLTLLRHAGLVPVHDFGLDESTGQPFLVMDRIPGTPFAQACQGKGWEWTLRAAREALAALDHLHRHGLIHRDIKSENVLVAEGTDPSRPLKVTVMDLGLAEDLATPGLAPGGTLLYVAPEILTGSRASARSDLFAFGVMLYLALTGRFPYLGASAEETIAASRRGTPAPPSTICSDLPSTIDPFLQRLLAAEPEARFPDAPAALEALERLMGGAPRTVESSRELSTELVGREVHLRFLLNRLDPGAKGIPPAVILHGEPGIGKTSLLSACLAELKVLGVRVALGVCREGGDQGLAPLAELLDEALAGASGSGTSFEDALIRKGRAALGFVDPRRWILTPAEGGEPMPPPSRAQALEDLAGVLIDLAAERPLVLAFDDLHLADPFVLDLFWLLTRRAGTRSLRLAATSRPPGDWPALDAVLSAASGEGLATSIQLGPLDEQEVQTLTTQVLGSARAAVLGRGLHTLTGGNPFFLMMVLGDLARRDDLPLDSTALTLPRNGQEAIQTCLARLDNEGRRLLQALAVNGQPSSSEDLNQLTGEDGLPLLDRLDELRLVLRLPGDRVDIAHGFLREAVLGTLKEEELRSWHRAWAALAGRDANRSVEAAGHWLAAGDLQGHRDLFLKTAEVLERSWRPLAAIPFLEAALAAMEPGDPNRRALFPRLESACNLVRDIPRAIAVCQAWAEEARRSGDRSTEARALGLLAARFRNQGNWQQARLAAEQALALAEQAGDSGTIALAEKILASVLWFSWEHKEALVHLERALSLFEKGIDRRALAICLHDISLLRTLAGQTDSGRRCLAEASRLFQEIGDRAWATMVHGNEALVLSYLGDLEGAAQVLRRTVAEVWEMGASLPLELALENLGLILLRLGRYTEAYETGGALIEEALRFGRHAFRVSGLLIRGEALYQLDDRNAARDHHRLAVHLAKTLGEEYQLHFARLAQARDLRGDGMLAEAREEARQVYESTRKMGNLRLITLACLELAQQALQSGDLTEAHRRLDQAEAALGVNREDAPAHRAMALGVRARVLHRQGHPALALGILEEALGLCRRAGPADLELRLLIHRAELAGEAGDADSQNSALALGARRYQQIADLQQRPEAKARFLGRPDLAALHSFLRRPRGGGTTLALSAAPADALASLYEVSRTIADGGDLDPLLTRIVNLAVERAGAERGLLLLRDAITGDLTPAASAGVEAETAADAIRISQSALNRADGGTSVLARDAASDPELSQAASVALFGIRSVMCVPLRTGEEVLGTLYVDTRAQDTFFSEEDLRFLQALADQASLALAYGRLVGNLAREREALRRLAEQTHSFGQIVGRSRVMREVFDIMARVAPSDLSVIIRGESGTGKELVARALHFNSSRRDKAFLSENCAAIPESLLESLLFGHVRGAFTGADQDRKGLFEMADGGTLFLDEIGDMSPALQAKLLRVLQEKEFRPLGSNRPVSVNVRVLAATHQDLSNLVVQGRFREDLYFRLNGITIQLPPLRERKEDIPLLFHHLMARECEAAGVTPPVVEASVLRGLMAYSWPGNVRELENIVRRMLLFAEGGRITSAGLRSDPDLRPILKNLQPNAPESSFPLSTPVLNPDSAVDLRRALEAAQGNKEKAAALLGISRATLYRRLAQFGLLKDH